MLFGVEGPDYLFYAAIFKQTAESAFGHTFHRFVPKYFFEKCFEDLKNTADENYEIKKGYILGILLHYFGDTTIHPYINWLEEFQNGENFKYIHMQNESEIDLLLYKMEYGKEISTFDPTKEMKYDKNFQRVVYEVWQNQDMQEISVNAIKKGCKLLALSGKVFNKNMFKWIFKIAEPKSAKGYFMCHFKDDVNEKVMNLEKADWTHEGETFNMSIPEIIDATMEKFYAEVEKINACIASGEKYEFTHTTDFNGRYSEKYV